MTIIIEERHVQLMFENINEISVLVAAILAAAVGSIWYSPLLFGPLWMKSIGITFADYAVPKKLMVQTIIKGVMLQALFFFVLAQFIAIGRNSALSLITVGTLLAMLILTQYMSPVIWEKKPISYFLIHAGYAVIIICGGMGIIAYWPW